METQKSKAKEKGKNRLGEIFVGMATANSVSAQLDPFYKALLLFRICKIDECHEECSRILEKNPLDQVSPNSRRFQMLQFLFSIKRKCLKMQTFFEWKNGGNNLRQTFIVGFKTSLFFLFCVALFEHGFSSAEGKVQTFILRESYFRTFNNLLLKYFLPR